MHIRKVFRDNFIEQLRQHQAPISDSGLLDFLHDMEGVTSAHEMFARAVRHFCLEDGQYNGYEIGITAAVASLSQATDTGLPKPAVVELGKLVQDGGGEFEALLSWAHKWCKV